MARRNLVPLPGIEPLSLYWKRGALTVGLSRKSWDLDSVASSGLQEKTSFTSEERAFMLRAALLERSRTSNNSLSLKVQYTRTMYHSQRRIKDYRTEMFKKKGGSFVSFIQTQADLREEDGSAVLLTKDPAALSTSLENYLVSSEFEGF